MRPTSSFRLTAPRDVADLIGLAAAHNPFLSQEEIVARELVTDRIGLLVAGRSSTATLLYLWTQAIDEVSPWMAHAAQWLERYQAWRRAHELAESDDPIRMVLAAPEMGPSVRTALRLIARPVILSRYVYGEIGGRPGLGWEAGSETIGPTMEVTAPAEPRPVVCGSIREPDDLTPEERAFFREG
jgi:hypothetical protein